MEKFLRIKTTQWRLEGVFEEQALLIEDMKSYFRKWRNSDLGSKSSTSIKEHRKIKQERANQTNKQSINQLINRLNVNKQILHFNKLSTISTSFQQF